MTARIFLFPETEDGRLAFYLAVVNGGPRDGRNFDDEADYWKSRYAEKQRLEAEARAAREAAEAERLAIEAASKIVPFRRVAGGRS